MCRHFKNNLDYLPLLQHPVCSLSLGTWTSGVGGARHLLVLRPNDTLGSALNLLLGGAHLLSTISLYMFSFLCEPAFVLLIKDKTKNLHLHK